MFRTGYTFTGVAGRQNLPVTQNICHRQIEGTGKNIYADTIKTDHHATWHDRDLHAFGNILFVMLDGEQTGGTLAVMSELTPPGSGPPLHVHSNEHEIFLVAEGRISYFVDGRWTEVQVCGAMYLSRGVAHRYRNIGATPSRHWIITLP